MISSKVHRQMLDYKVAKIIRLIKKIRGTLQEEGLDQAQLPKLINQSLELTQSQETSESYRSSLF